MSGSGLSTRRLAALGVLTAVSFLLFSSSTSRALADSAAGYLVASVDDTGCSCSEGRGEPRRWSALARAGWGNARCSSKSHRSTGAALAGGSGADLSCG